MLLTREATVAESARASCSAVGCWKSADKGAGSEGCERLREGMRCKGRGLGFLYRRAQGGDR